MNELFSPPWISFTGPFVWLCWSHTFPHCTGGMSNGSTFVCQHCWTNNVHQFDPRLIWLLKTWQRPLCLYLQLIIMMYKPVKHKIKISVWMGLMSLEEGLNKIHHIDVFLYKKYFWLFPEITSSYLPNLDLSKILNPICNDFNNWGFKRGFHWYLSRYLMRILWRSLQMLVSQYLLG